MMLEEMTSEEYNDWMAYFSIEPFPEDRADLRNAQLLSILIQTGSQGKSNPKVSDLIPNWWGVERKQSAAQIQQNMTVVAAGIMARQAGKKKS